MCVCAGVHMYLSHLVSDEIISELKMHQTAQTTRHLSFQSLLVGRCLPASIADRLTLPNCTDWLKPPPPSRNLLGSLTKWDEKWTMMPTSEVSSHNSWPQFASNSIWNDQNLWPKRCWAQAVPIFPWIRQMSLSCQPQCEIPDPLGRHRALSIQTRALWPTGLRG